MRFSCPPPPDFGEILNHLRKIGIQKVKFLIEMPATRIIGLIFSASCIVVMIGMLNVVELHFYVRWQGSFMKPMFC